MVNSTMSATPRNDAATIRVLIVDDQPPFRAAARTVVALLKGWEVVAEVDSGEDALTAVEQTDPVVVLMDINLPGISGIEATRLITAAHPATRVVLMSTYQADDLPADAADCGASAYVRKEDLTPRVLRDIMGG
jgi:DNA-binding NarL/FixJ family response regulator